MGLWRISDKSGLRFPLNITIIRRIGAIKANLKTALQIQLPPDKSIARFKTNVTAKKNEANMPSAMAFKGLPPFK